MDNPEKEHFFPGLVINDNNYLRLWEFSRKMHFNDGLVSVYNYVIGGDNKPDYERIPKSYLMELIDYVRNLNKNNIQ